MIVVETMMETEKDMIETEILEIEVKTEVEVKIERGIADAEMIVVEDEMNLETEKEEIQEDEKKDLMVHHLATTL